MNVQGKQRAANTYSSQGYVFPLSAMGTDETNAYRECYESYSASIAEHLQTHDARDHYLWLAETHMYLPWVHELAVNPVILDVIEAILGPDLLLFDSRWFTKQPGDGTFVSWHQDANYWGLEPNLACTAWLALTTSTVETGCMRVVPNSHHQTDLPHKFTDSPQNALARGQEISVEVDESEADDLVLSPGEFSLHHPSIIHGSRPNTSTMPRIGIALRYIPAQVRQHVTDPLAMLVRGNDTYSHFDLIPPPTSSDLDEIARLRKNCVRRVYGNLSSVE